jgi:hypothetical protein
MSAYRSLISLAVKEYISEMGYSLFRIFFAQSDGLPYSEYMDRFGEIWQ